MCVAPPSPCPIAPAWSGSFTRVCRLPMEPLSRANDYHYRRDAPHIMALLTWALFLGLFSKKEHATRSTMLRPTRYVASLFCEKINNSLCIFNTKGQLINFFVNHFRYHFRHVFRALRTMYDRSITRSMQMWVLIKFWIFSKYIPDAWYVFLYANEQYCKHPIGVPPILV